MIEKITFNPFSSGFSIDMDNGYVVSVVWGGGTYSTNRIVGVFESLPKDGMFTADNVEVAIKKKDESSAQDWLEFDPFDPFDTAGNVVLFYGMAGVSCYVPVDSAFNVIQKISEGKFVFNHD